MTAESISLGGEPIIGFGNPALVVPAAATPWGEIIVTSVVSAAAGWGLEELATRYRKKRRR